MSSPQSVSTVVVFDYLYDSSGKAVVGRTVNCTLNINDAMVVTPQVSLGPIQQSTVTDNNGYYQFNLVPNININPANTTYEISTGFNTWSISIPSGAGPFQVTASNVLVNQPGVLTPVAGNVTGPLTITGNETVTGNESVGGTLGVTGGTTLAGLTAGATSVGGDLTVSGRILETTAASKLVPGATSWALRDNADANNNLLVSNAGALTVRSGLTVTAGGETITAGGLIVSAGGVTSTGTPDVTLGTAASRLVPGTASMSLRNHANSSDNLIVLDSGNTTIRGTLTVQGAGPITSATTNFHMEAYESGVQGAVGNGGNSNVQYATTLADPNGNFSGGTTYTCPIAGRYLVAASAGTSTTITGRVILAMNGTSADNKRLFDGYAPGGFQIQGSAIARCNLGDTIIINFANNSGGSLTLQGTQAVQYLQIHYLGPL